MSDEMSDGASTRSFRIADRWIGAGRPCFIMAEVALAHDGSLGLAHAFIDAVARTGADCVKFQTHIASAESTADEPFRVHFSRQDATRYAYWERTAFTAEQWRGLAEHAADAGLIFLSSPFSEAAVDLLDTIGVPAWKIGSGEVGNDLLLRRAAATAKPVLLSSGLSDLAELDRAVALVRNAGADVAVFQCTSRYPCPPEALGLEQVRALAHRYACPAGLSDHSGTIYAGLGAVTLGAHMLEVHVTLSRDMFGPDVVASLTIPELRSLVEGTRFLERAIASPVDKSSVGEDALALRAIFTKRLVAARRLAAGTVLTAQDIAAKKPGNGLPSQRLDEVLGRMLRRPLEADEPLRPEDLEVLP
jgi:N-acetylneuraminate synthase